MDKEERIKYDCEKDKEHFEKFKNGKSSLYLTEKARKDIYCFVAAISIELLIFSLIGNAFFIVNNDINEKSKDMLIKQVNQYIKNDFKDMNCIDKNVFLEKYSSDPTIYLDPVMKQWLEDNFDNNCNLNKK